MVNVSGHFACLEGTLTSSFDVTDAEKLNTMQQKEE